MALFRSRTSTRETKRSAVVALARVLEGRRPQIVASLGKKESGALFHIANDFDLRHREGLGRGKPQYTDYEDAFLDWIFYWYLSTISLCDQLVATSNRA